MKTFGIFSRDNKMRKGLIQILTKSHNKEIFYVSSKNEWKEYKKQPWIVINEFDSSHYPIMTNLINLKNGLVSPPTVGSVENDILYHCECIIISAEESPDHRDCIYPVVLSMPFEKDEDKMKI